MSWNHFHQNKSDCKVFWDRKLAFSWHIVFQWSMKYKIILKPRCSITIHNTRKFTDRKKIKKRRMLLILENCPPRLSKLEKNIPLIIKSVIRKAFSFLSCTLCKYTPWWHQPPTQMRMPHPGSQSQSPSHLCSSPGPGQTSPAQCSVTFLGQRHWCRRLQTGDCEDYFLQRPYAAPSQSPGSPGSSWLLQSF